MWGWFDIFCHTVGNISSVIPGIQTSGFELVWGLTNNALSVETLRDESGKICMLNIAKETWLFMETSLNLMKMVPPAGVKLQKIERSGFLGQLKTKIRHAGKQN